MTDTLTITRPDDWHLHLRQGEMLEQVVPASASIFGRALIMPNTVPPILSGLDAGYYKQEILRATEKWEKFQPVMSIKLTMNTTARMIHEAAEAGVKAVKLYPTGVTTNSQDGVDLGRLKEMAENLVFDAMADNDMVLCIHAEHPSQPVLEREPYVIPFIKALLGWAPRLERIVVEHVSTQTMAQFVASYPDRLGATITAHHLYLTLDDLLGEELKPHYFCKPVVKTSTDQNNLWWYLQRCDNFFFGSDSAPHSVDKKESCHCAAGAFTAPMLLPLLAHMFEQRKALDLLEAFVSFRGADFYGFDRNDDTITLVKSDQPFVVEFDKEHKDKPRPMPLRQGDDIYWHIAK